MKGLLIIIGLNLLLFGCMPDSFTKFNDTKSAGGQVGGTPATPAAQQITPLINIKYAVEGNSKLILNLDAIPKVNPADPASLPVYQTNNFISSPNGFLAKIDIVDTTKNQIQVTVCPLRDSLGNQIASGNTKCDNSSSYAPNGYIVSSDPIRLSESSIDSNDTFFTKQSMIKKIIRLLPTSKRATTFTPIANIKSSLEPNELSGLINSVSGTVVTGVSVGPKATLFKTQLKINSYIIIKGQIRRIISITNDYILTVNKNFVTSSFTTMMNYQSSDIVSTNYQNLTYSFSPNPQTIGLQNPTNTSSISSGLITNVSVFNSFTLLPQTVSSLTREVPETLFNITATDQYGNSSNTLINLMTASSPQYLSTYDHVLLKVNDSTNFKIGEFISGQLVGPVVENATGIVESEGLGSNKYVEVKVLTGTFKPNFQLDNQKTFGKEVSRVDVSDSVFPYNTRVKLSDTFGNFLTGAFVKSVALADATPTYGTISKDLVTVGGKYLYINLVSGGLQDQNSLTPSSDGGATFLPSATLLEVKSSTLLVTASRADSNAIVGNYLSTSEFSLGQIHAVPTTTTLVVDSINGPFNQGFQLGFSNKFSSTIPLTTISNVTTKTSYYGYVNEKLFIPSALKNGSDITYSLSPTLPNGLTLDTATGMISGTPLVNFNLTTFTLTAQNLYGTATHSFHLKIYDHVSITDVSSSFSNYIHRSGQFLSSKDCRVTKESIISGSQKEIICYLDVGETDLYSTDLAFEVNAGSNLCQKLNYAPYSIYRKPAESTDVTSTNPIIKNLNDTDKPSCSAANGPHNGGPINNIENHPNLDAANLSYTLSDQNFCKTDYSNVLNIDNPVNCDAGLIHFEDDTYTESDACLAGGGTCTGTNITCSGRLTYTTCVQDTSKTCTWNSTFTSQTSCEDNNGTCNTASGAVDGGLSNRSACVIVSTCTDGVSANQAACDAAVPVQQWQSNTWTPTANIWGKICNISVSKRIYDCLGNKNNCLDGAIRTQFSDTELQSNLDSVSINIPKDMPYKSSSSQIVPIKSSISQGYRSNISAANYVKANSCSSNGYNFNAKSWKSTALNQTIVNSPRSGANPEYTFECADSAGTPKVTFKVYVREWDKEFKLSSSIDRYNPDFGNNYITNFTSLMMDNSVFNDRRSLNNLFSYSKWNSTVANYVDTTLESKVSVSGIEDAPYWGCGIPKRHITSSLPGNLPTVSGSAAISATSNQTNSLIKGMHIIVSCDSNPRKEYVYSIKSVVGTSIVLDQKAEANCSGVNTKALEKTFPDLIISLSTSSSIMKVTHAVALYLQAGTQIIIDGDPFTILRPTLNADEFELKSLTTKAYTGSKIAIVSNLLPSTVTTAGSVITRSSGDAFSTHLQIGMHLLIDGNTYTIKTLGATITVDRAIVPAHATAISSIIMLENTLKLTGTVNVNAGENFISAGTTATKFLSEVSRGSYLLIGGEKVLVKSVASDSLIYLETNYMGIFDNTTSGVTTTDSVTNQSIFRFNGMRFPANSY